MTVELEIARFAPPVIIVAVCIAILWWEFRNSKVEEIRGEGY